jgi:glycosyltransferase involved in cell wall biosynthesis
MKKKPLISVIIPCYNAEQFAESAVRSIMTQTYTNLEILCINDCSTDNTPSILNKLALEDKRVKVINNETNLKLIKTLNKGIDLCKGEYIARMDADDISLPARFETQLRVFEDDPSLSLVALQAKRLTESGKILSVNPFFACHETGSIRFMNMIDSPIIHPSVLVRTAVIKKYKYSLDDYALHNEDFDLWARMLFNGERFKVIEKPILFLFRHNNQSVTQKNLRVQAQKHSACMYQILGRELGITCTNEVLELLAGNETGYSVKSLRDTLRSFSVIKRLYLRRFKSTLNHTELNEVNSWYKQRCIYIIMNNIFHGNYRVKTYATIQLLKRPDLYFNTKTYRNFYLRFKWIVFEKRFL